MRVIYCIYFMHIKLESPFDLNPTWTSLKKKKKKPPWTTSLIIFNHFQIELNKYCCFQSTYRVVHLQ